MYNSLDLLSTGYHYYFWNIMDQATIGQESEFTQSLILFIIFFLAFYLILSAYLEEKKSPIHRATVAILVGIIAGIILKTAAPDTYSSFVKIDQVIIFSVLFPPMIFTQGYTLHKAVFFKNIKNILIFGLLGTFISFLISWGLIYQANSLSLVRDAKDIKNFRSLSDWEILLLAACLCSIDTTSAEQQVCEFKYPRLYSIILGEDILKDAVTIVLFDSILSLEQTESPDKLVIYWYTFFQMLLNFLILILGSVAIGTASAFISTFLNKKMRFLTKDKGVSQTGFLFLMGFLTYILTQMLGFSGSISLLLYGVLLNHYNIYNMSEQSKNASVCTFSLISNICEGALFLIMGAMMWQGQWQSPQSDEDKMTHSYLFFFVVMVILCVGRFANIYLLGWLTRFFTKEKKEKAICNQQMHILFLGGLVRGAVPFVLFSSVSFTEDSRYNKNEGIVLKTTIIFVIIFTSVVLNSLFPLIYKRRVKYLKKQYKKIFGDLSKIQQKKTDESNQLASPKGKGKIKQFQEKFIKKFLIFDYFARKQTINKEKKARLEAAMAQAFSQNETEDQLLTVTEDQHKQNLILN